MKKQQVLMIHGGMAFRTQEEYLAFLRGRIMDIDRLRVKRDWNDTLQDELGDAYDVLKPRMPNGTNAQYEEWKLWFEKILDVLDDGIILVGHSLGGIFLAKYLSENLPVKKIKAAFLVAAPFHDKDMDESLASFSLSHPLNDFSQKAGKIFFYQSKDDPVVPFSHAKRYQERIPSAVLCMFEDRQHFNQERFPELIADIRDASNSTA